MGFGQGAVRRMPCEPRKSTRREGLGGGFRRPRQSRHPDGPDRTSDPGQTGEELERRGHRFCRYADDCNIYVGSQAAAERTLSVQAWIEKHLRLKLNTAKSGTGRVWERKFLGFRLDRKRRIGIAPESLERFKGKVREMWDGRRSRTSNQLRDDWSRYIRGWWEYFRLAEARRPVRDLEAWTRRHIRKCFWLRWHDRRGRLRRPRAAVPGPPIQIVTNIRKAVYTKRLTQPLDPIEGLPHKRT